MKILQLSSSALCALCKYFMNTEKTGSEGVELCALDVHAVAQKGT